ncbi:MAG: T9SS type A sorting domain-containing protein [Chitinophagaceae bacterium]
MKTTRNKFVTYSVLFVLLFSLPFYSFSQALPDYSFENGRLESGRDGTVGAIYRFTNVRSGTDGLIRINSITGGAVIQHIDRVADGYKEAFQPEIRVPANRDGAVEFQVTFVTTGTSTPLRQTEVKASALDIDGDSGPLFEYNQLDMGGGVANFNTRGSHLTILPVGRGFRATNITGVLFGASVDTTALDVMFSVRNAGISTFTWRTGVNNLLNSREARRYTSLYFKTFAYNDRVLSSPKIINFNGNADGNKVALSWNIEAEAGYTCSLEKAGDDNKFVAIEGVSKGNSQSAYSYTENLALGKSLYRVKLTNPEGQVKYSSIVSFQKGIATSKELKVYPSVVTNNQFVLNIAADKQVQGLVQLVNYAGMVVYKKQMTLNAGSNNVSVSDFSSTLKGNYVVIAKSGSNQYTSKIIIR